MIDLEQLRYRRRRGHPNVIEWPREWQRESPVMTIEIDTRLSVIRLAQAMAKIGAQFTPLPGDGLRLEPTLPEGASTNG